MEERKGMHWANKYAEQIIKAKEKDRYIVESGITPSGVVHAGNWREELTQEFVYKALIQKGVTAIYQHVWDDFDRFRKVPKGVPSEWEQYIGMPGTKIPDPWECHKSYAEHFKAAFMEEADALGLEATYLSMTEEYGNCVFADQVKIALENRDFIKKTFDEYRREPLEDVWMPAKVYCEKCWKDTTTFEWDKSYNVKYKCKCGNEGEFDFRKVGMIKLLWRVDWPMRMAHYDIDFESAGKDHHASGGSMTTGMPIYEKIYHGKGFIAPMYEHINFKGQTEKMSSSKGNVVTMAQLLEVYEPEVIRYMYTTKINRAFDISFDLDLVNTYNYFDKAEAMYYRKEEVDENEKNRYVLSIINKSKEIPEQAQFSQCANTIQIAVGNVDRTIEILKKTGAISEGTEKTRNRLRLAQTWIEKYAPDQAKFSIVKEMPQVEVPANISPILAEISTKVGENTNGEDLQSFIFNQAKTNNIPPKELFSTIYKLLIGRERGPKLGPFLSSLDSDFVQKRLSLMG